MQMAMFLGYFISFYLTTLLNLRCLHKKEPSTEHTDGRTIVVTNQSNYIHTDRRIIVGQCREAIRYSDHGMKTLEGRGHAPKESPWINVSPPGCIQVSIQANKI
jgi:hypothetical protein